MDVFAGAHATQSHAVISPVFNLSARAPRSAAGFSLLEVLVALMIFALSAIVLGSTYVNILNSYEAVARGNLKFVSKVCRRFQLELRKGQDPSAETFANAIEIEKKKR